MQDLRAVTAAEPITLPITAAISAIVYSALTLLISVII